MRLPGWLLWHAGYRAASSCFLSQACCLEFSGSGGNHGNARFHVARLAGAGGFEPPNGGIKIRCLTAWLRPTGPGEATLSAKPPAGNKAAGRAPPAGLGGGEPGAGVLGDGAIGEQGEAGGAAAAHPRQERAGQPRQRREHDGDFGKQPIAASVSSLRRRLSTPARRAASRGIGANRPGSPNFSISPDRARRAANTAAVGSAMRGLASTIPAAGSGDAGSISSPMPPTQQGAACRQAGTSAPSRAPRRRRVSSSIGSRQSAHSARSAAAASLDPPPMPAETGRRLCRWSAAPARPRRERRAPGGAQHQVVLAEAGEARRLQPVDLERQLGRRARRYGRRYRRTRPGCRSGDSRPPAAPGDADRVELCRGENGGGRRPLGHRSLGHPPPRSLAPQPPPDRRATALGSPLSSLASIGLTSSLSGLNASAWRH